MIQPSAERKSEMLKRLARVEGQVRGVHKLVESDADCEKVLQQMTAARKALDRAFYEMMACIIEASVVDVPVNESHPQAALAERMAEVRSLLSKYA